MSPLSSSSPRAALVVPQPEGIALRPRGLERYEDAHFVVEAGPVPAVARQVSASGGAFEAQVLDGLFLAPPPSARGYARFARALAAIPPAEPGADERADGRVDTWA